MKSNVNVNYEYYKGHGATADGDGYYYYVHLPDADNGEELAAGKDLSKKEEPTEPDSKRRRPPSSVRKSLGPIASRATLSATGALPAARFSSSSSLRQARIMSQPTSVRRQV